MLFEVGQAQVQLCRVDSPRATTFYLNEHAARDAVLAYAMRDEVATLRREFVFGETIEEIDERGGVKLLSPKPELV